ncbi:porin [uncultured Paraglaciecola sp.]|uniref:porin n=1 Tax=uncultured Paraglaciecola sp. TaxID=1765024 RepID=UPI002639D12B|nr:porin [uncultured Paraglaciecola sp.]
MKPYRNLTVLFFLSCLASAVTADPLTFYGKANVSMQSTDEGDGRFLDIKSNASRLGVKGNLALSSELEVLYIFEWEVDLADESGSDNIKSRNQYVGLKGQFGTVLLGRNDTVLKQSQGKIDQFGDYEADLKGLWKGENRMADSLTYFSPSYYGVTFGISYITEGEVTAEDAQSVSVTYGDKNFKKNLWYVSASADFDVKGYDTQRLSLQTKFDELVLGAIFQHQESSDTRNSKSGAMISAAYTLGSIVLKTQFQTLKDDNSFSVGADYKLAKSTKLFAWYTSRGLDDSADQSWLSAGIEHKF